MTKWAIYRTSYGGLYAVEYVDTLKACKNHLCGRFIKKEDLPILINSAGGRTSFDPSDKNFVHIIKCKDDEGPLTREQMYPKNSDMFEFGWIDPDGNTYVCDHEGHWRSAKAICDEAECDTYNAERFLEERGWVKVTASWDKGIKRKRVFVSNRFLTKKQADTLVDLGLHQIPEVEMYIQLSAEQW